MAAATVVALVLGLSLCAQPALGAEKAPTITKQPVSLTVDAGQSAKFEAAASGSPGPSVQWEASTDGGSTWGPVAGGTSTKLTIASAKVSESGDRLRATFTNSAGHATTNQATLTVYEPPIVTQQPAAEIVEEGQSASFEAAAAGVPAPTVQWERSTNGGSTWSPLAGATADQLTVADVVKAESGYEYRAVFTSVAGKATSNAATLTVPSDHYLVVGWGANVFGQLGDGGNAQSDLPTIAGGLRFVTAVAAGGRHSLALLSDGSVMAWGAGGDGQLGDGSLEGSEVPVPVQGLSDVKAIAAGANFSLALLSNGTVMTWGANESGQLGAGMRAGSDVPVSVKGISTATAVAAGGEHSLALLAGGTVMAWGGDEYCQLGYHAVVIRKEEEEIVEEPEEEPFSDVPVSVKGLSGVTSLAAGGRHSLALLSNGTAMAWGAGASGQLGNGALPSCQASPVAVSGLSGVSAVSAGAEDSVALLENGSVRDWGDNRSGELGDGHFGGFSDVPVAVVGLGETIGIAAGGGFELAYSEPIPAVTSVSPAIGAEAGETEVTISGANFEEVAQVYFGSTPARRFVVDSPTSITAYSPAGGVGTVDITVSNPAGRSPTVTADRFTYLPPPTVKKLSLKKGPGTGGSTVTITGTGFEGVTKVSFGASEAEGVKVESASTITVRSPPEAGSVDVTVAAAGGTSPATKKDLFEYVPAVEALAPSSGPVAGGAPVTISGAGFALGAGATAFKLGSKYATEVSCVSHTSCSALTPAGKPGAVAVQAIVGKAKSAAEPGDLYTYE